MQIEDTRHTTLDDFSVGDVRVRYDWDRPPAAYVHPTIHVSLEPKKYMRNRFAEGGASYETKKHGARRLIFRLDELQTIMEAIKDEMQLCHELLLKHD